MTDEIKMTGEMTAVLKRSNGEVVTTVKKNLIVDGGFDFICNAVGNASRPAAMGYIGVGTGTTAAAVTDTALGSQLLRKAATYTHTTGTKIMTFVSSFAAGEATGAITEAGVFNAATSGTMLDRVVFSVINKGADDTLSLTFKFTLS